MRTPENEKMLDAEREPVRRRRRCPAWMAAVGVLALIVLAVVLGTSIGLTRKHGKKSTSTLTAARQSSSSFILQGRTLAAQSPQTRTYQFVVERGVGAVDGVEKPMLFVNGTYPGPTLEVNAGDRLIVNVTNRLNTSTAIHWHGLYQYMTNFYDGTAGVTQCGIPPGESLAYDFTFAGPNNTEFSGTTWWHAHLSTQYTDGISGALVVHPTQAEAVPAYDGEVVIQMADLYHNFSSGLLSQYLSPYGVQGEGLTAVAPGNEPVPDSGSINGFGQWGNATASYFNVTLEANKTYRLRLVNTGSFGAQRFSVDNHTLTVIEADGTIVDPYEVSGVSLAVAQRYSVLLTTNQAAGAYWMRSVADDTMFTYTVDGANYNQLAVLRYGTSDSAMPDSALIENDPGAGDDTVSDMDTTLLVPEDRADVPASTVTYPVSVSLQNAASGQFLAFMNSTSWSPLSGTSTLFSKLGSGAVGPQLYDDSQLILSLPTAKTVDLIVGNLDDGDHPFHLHGHKFAIVGSGAGRYDGTALNATSPMRRDTVVIPAYTWMALRFSSANPGYWLFHCHISWHMSAGLAFTIASLADISTLAVPQAMLDQCARAKGATIG